VNETPGNMIIESCSFLGAAWQNYQNRR